MPAPPSTDRVVIDRGPGVSIELLRDGPPDGPAIVLLPSSLRDSRDFGPLVQPLAAAGWCVLRPQPRGMGASSPPAADLTLADLAGDVAAAIEACARDARAVVVGHAFGHFVARMTDRLHPARVRGVVVLAGAARVFPAGLQESLAIVSDPAQPEALRLEHLQRAFFAPGHDPRPWLDGWHPQWRAAYRHAAAHPEKDVWWPVANAPILDLQGECDPWRPRDTRDELRDALGPGIVSVCTIHGASHAMVPEGGAAAAAVAAILNWERLI